MQVHIYRIKIVVIHVNTFREQPRNARLKAILRFLTPSLPAMIAAIVVAIGVFLEFHLYATSYLYEVAAFIEFLVRMFELIPIYEGGCFALLLGQPLKEKGSTIFPSCCTASVSSLPLGVRYKTQSYHRSFIQEKTTLEKSLS